DNEIPTDLSFLSDHAPAHYEGAPSYTPSTSVVEAPAVIGQKKTMTFIGGVDYCADLDLLSAGNAVALAGSALGARQEENQLAWTFEQGGTNYNASALSVDRTPKDGGRGEVAVDASFALPGGQALLLCRHLDSFNVAPSMFGWGWQAQPYALEFKGERSGMNYCHQTQGAYSEVLFTDRARRTVHSYVLTGTYDRSMDILGIAARFDPNETILAYSQDGKATPGLLFSDNKTRLTMRLQDGTLLDFDFNGRLTGMTDSNGNAIVYGYDNQQRLVSIGRPGGRTITFGYDAQGRATLATLPDSRTITYTYDAVGNLASAQVGAPSGVLKRYAYDADHQLRAVLDENGEAVLNYAYDVYGRMTQAQQTGVATPLKQTYNLAAKTTQTTGPEGYSGLVEFNEQHDPARVTDARSNARELTYNSRRDLIRIKEADGGITRHYYDGLGFHSATVAPGGRADCTLNDRTGRVIGFFHAPVDAAFTGSFDTEQIQRDNKMLNYLVNLTRFGYDAKGNLTSVTDANGRISSLTYDAAGNLSSATDASGYRTDLTSDAHARLTRVRNAAGHQIDFSYDAHDNLTRTATAAGAVDYAYDSKNRLTSVTMGDLGARRIETYVYDDAKGQLKTVTDAAGTETEYAYDPRGNLVEVRHNGIVRFTHEYDGLNRLVRTRTNATHGGARAAIIPLTPRGAQSLGGGIAITWQASGDWGIGGTVSLQYSTDGTSWIDIATVSQALGSYLWNAGSLDSNSVRIRLIRTDDPGFQQATTPLFSVKPAGSLKFNLAPAAAVTAGARWRVDAGPWLESGAQVDALPAGAHRIDIKAPPDWDAAASQTVTVVANATTQASAILTQALATLTLESTGSGVVRVNGQAAALPYTHDFLRGDVVTLAADSQVYWTGDVTGPASPTTLVMNGRKAVTANFGTIAEAGNLVWHDVNGNGLQDAEEPGLPNMTVKLHRSVDGVAGNADDVWEAVQVTDTAGYFSFKGLLAGRNYYLAFTAPPGFKPTLKNQGSNTTLDSDVDPALGRTAIFSLVAGEAALAWDAGMAAGNKYYVNDVWTPTDFYCTSSGSDGIENDGRSPAAPKATLQAILSNYDLNGGDVVYIDTGVYNLAATLNVNAADEGTPGSKVSLIGSPVPGGTVFIRTSGTSRALAIFSDYMVIQNLNIKGGLYLDHAVSCKVANCRFYGASNSFSGIYAYFSSQIELENNIIDNNAGDGIAVSSTGTVTLKNNTIYGNYGDQISFDNSNDIQMFNNNFWASRSSSYAAYIYPSLGAVTGSDYNNLFISPNARLSLDASLTFPIWKLITGHDSHSLSVDPLFVDADGADNIAGNEDDDLHLKSTGGSWHGGTFAADAADSPLLDAGDPEDSMGAESAPHGGRINIGAHGGTMEASRSATGQLLSLSQPANGNLWLWFQPLTWLAT
ncbi:MAG TPA: SdrD B-like domain-containing protein, partial [Prosthecobacter sp.]|nr:SdrD B-like domain-containing protein [Prosthecobacter sp.]